MKNLKHTAGEWHIVNASNSQFAIMADNSAIAFIPKLHKDTNANSRLIAAAPEMLNCLLKFMMEDVEMPISLISKGLREEILNTVKKAIE